MLDDCCGGGGPAWPGPAPTVWPCANDTGTNVSLEHVDTPSMQWEGMADASTILHGEPAFSPPDNRALVTLVESRNRLQRSHHGFPSDCFATGANCHQAFDLAVVQNWRYHAKMLEFSYNNDPTAGKYLQTFCPCLTRGVWIPNTDSDTPGTMFAETADWNIVYISGTSTDWQKMGQGLSGVVGPTAGDGFGTLPFWYLNYFRIHLRLIAQGLTSKKNWFIAGHSYGGALACILAAVVQRADAERKVKLFTCGSPSPGDQRLIDLLHPVDQVHLQNIGDPVCSLPPYGLLLDNVAWLLPGPLQLAWSQYSQLRSRVNISETGVRTAVNEGSIDYSGLLTIVAAAVAGTWPAEPLEHRASVYYARCSIVQ